MIKLDVNERKESMDLFARAIRMDYGKHNEIFEYAPILKNDNEILSLISALKK